MRAMLERAWARWDLVRGPVERERLSLHEGDFTAFRTSERFDLVFIAVNTFLLAEDDSARLALLRAMREQLRPGGIAVIEVSTPDDDELADFDGRLQLEWLRHEPESGDLVAKLVSARHDAEASSVTLCQVFEWTPAHGGPLCPRDPDGHPAPRLRDATWPIWPWQSGFGERGPLGGPSIHTLWLRKSPGHPRGAVGIVRRVATSEQIRLLLVEDVAQVSQYVRNLLQHQKQVRLLDTVTDGRVVLDRIRELRPDVLMVDALLQGKASGLEVAEQVRQAGLRIPIIIVTVPAEAGEGRGGDGHHRGALDALLGLRAHERAEPRQQPLSRHRAERHVALVRRLLRQGWRGPHHHRLQPGRLASGRCRACAWSSSTATSSSATCAACCACRTPLHHCCSCPTDRISESDLASVLWRDPSGIDLLLAPPRVEQAEMVTARDVEKVVSLLRRIYNVIVVDAPPAITDTTLVYLDDADGILTVVTPDRNSVRAARLAGQAFVAAGMSPHKMMLVLNRAGTPGITPEQMAAELGRLPDVAIPDDQPLVKATTAEGVPFVMAHPKAACQPAHHEHRPER